MNERSALFAAAAALAGCSLLVDLGELGDAGANDALAPDVVLCSKGQGTGGPDLVQADFTCIDSTEVTVAQYNQFLDAGALVDAPARCSWKTSYAPQTDGASGCTPDKTALATRGDYPIACVDWCDAWSFCAWAGKRLCGTLTGSIAPPVTSQSLSGAQWYLACTHTGDYEYPMGATYTTGECNTQGGDGAAPVKSFAKCVGGYPGIYDLAGNVEEWVDSCTDKGDAGDPRTDDCYEEGDGFRGPTSPAGVAQCVNIHSDKRAAMDEVIGFRCCSL
jgi:formylglycine-generating enzyme required for sulfatase activity